MLRGRAEICGRGAGVLQDQRSEAGGSLADRHPPQRRVDQVPPQGGHATTGSLQLGLCSSLLLVGSDTIRYPARMTICELPHDVCCRQSVAQEADPLGLQDRRSSGGSASGPCAFCAEVNVSLIKYGGAVLLARSHAAAHARLRRLLLDGWDMQ